MGHKLKAILAGLLLLALGASAQTDISRGKTLSDGVVLHASDLHTLVDSATIQPTFYSSRSEITTALPGANYLLTLDPSSAVFRKVSVNSFLYGNTNIWLNTTASAAVPYYGTFLFYNPTNNGIYSVQGSNVFGSLSSYILAANLIGGQPAITNLVAPDGLFMLHGGTNVQIASSNLWLNLHYTAAFTNQLLHTAPTNDDRILIWDSLALTNKQISLAGLITNLPALSWATNASTNWFQLTNTDQFIVMSTINSTNNGVTNILSKVTLAQLRAANTFTTTNFPMVNATGNTNAHNAAHGFGQVPRTIKAVLACVTAELGYSILDEIDGSGVYCLDASNLIVEPALAVWGNSTNVGCTLRYDSATKNVYINSKLTGTASAITKANWNLRIYATP